VETALVAVLGGALALAANGISPRGLALSRNYFPGPANVPPPVQTSTNQSTPGTAAGTNAASARDRLTALLKAEGLQPLDLQQAEKLFHDPRRAQGLIQFIDARNDAHYQAGHIPGAYQLDHYEFVKQPVPWLTALLPICQPAQQIVVYCNGGECEDSRYAAMDLRDAQVPKEKLFVYEGGFAEWATNGLPVEIGPRSSGKLLESRK
jgi:rhodanese-related sulfurtransferase